MKKIVRIILTLIAVNSFAGEIPEAKSLDPELYTIQITCLKYYEEEYLEKEDLLTKDQLKKLEKIKDEHRKLNEEIVEYKEEYGERIDEEEMEEAESLFRWRGNKLQIKRAEVLSQGYTDTVTIYTRSGEPFSGERGIKGILDVERNKINFTCSNDLFTTSSNPDPGAVIPIYVNEWSYIANSIRGIDRSYVLVKYYPSTNVPSIQKVDSTEETPVESGE